VRRELLRRIPAAVVDCDSEMSSRCAGAALARTVFELEHRVVGLLHSQLQAEAVDGDE
jgi:hypothetical protein